LMLMLLRADQRVLKKEGGFQYCTA
jgi:hypothetical protein